MSSQCLVAVIDDDAPFRGALVASLDSLGYRAQGYASADEFVAAGGETSCDCVVTDIHMPGMSGIDLKLLLSARGLKLPVIMITARSDPGLKTRAMASGAVCLLKKPFDPDALVHCLDLAFRG